MHSEPRDNTLLSSMHGLSRCTYCVTSDQILASPRVLVKWPTMSLEIPMLSFSQGWLHLPSVTRGCSTCKCLVQTVPPSHTKRKGPLSPVHCFSLERKTFCRRSQETSPQFPWLGLGHMPFLWLQGWLGCKGLIPYASLLKSGLCQPRRE